MHLNYRGIVERRYREDGGPRFVLSQWSFEAWSVYPQEEEATKLVADADCRVSVQPFDRDIFLRSDDYKSLLDSRLVDEKRGGVLVAASNPLLSQIDLTVLVAKGSDYPSELAESLRTEHLGVGLDVELLFSFVAGNDLMKWPVTFDEFKHGKPLWVEGVPDFYLLRRVFS